MKHIELAIAIETALVVFIDTLEGVLDTCKVGNTSVHSLKQFYHRQEGTVESRNVIVVERKVGSTAGNLLDVLCQFFDATNLWEWRSHSAYAPCTNLLGMFCQATTFANAAATNVYDNLEVLGGCSHPSFCNLHTLLARQHIAFTAGAIDEYSLKSVLCQHLCIGGNRFQIHITILLEGCKRGIDEAHNFLKLFHNIKVYG